MTALSLALLAAALGAAPAAEPAYWTWDASDLPAVFDRSPHFYEGATLGTCRRDHGELAGIGTCGEVFLALGKRVSRRVQLDVEAGAGLAANDRRSGDEALGVAHYSGGPWFFTLRGLLTFDFTRYFFARPGLQLRLPVGPGLFLLGGQVVIDHGTRIGKDLELGVRFFAGVDTLATRPGSGFELAPCLGAMALLRFVLR